MRPPAQSWTGQSQTLLSLPDRHHPPHRASPAQPGPSMLPQGPQKVKPGPPGPQRSQPLLSRTSLKSERVSVIRLKQMRSPTPSLDSACHTEGQQRQISQLVVHSDPRVCPAHLLPHLQRRLGKISEAVFGLACSPHTPPGSALLPATVVLSQPHARAWGVRPGGGGGLAVAQDPEPPGGPGQGSDSPQSLRHRSLLLPWPLSLTPGGSGGRGGPACRAHQLRVRRAALAAPGWVPR